MARHGRFGRTFDDEGFRIPKHQRRDTHGDHLNEKRLQSTLRSKHLDDLLDDDDDFSDPHWLYRDKD